MTREERVALAVRVASKALVQAGEDLEALAQALEQDGDAELEQFRRNLELRGIEEAHGG